MLLIMCFLQYFVSNFSEISILGLIDNIGKGTICFRKTSQQRHSGEGREDRCSGPALRSPSEYVALDIGIAHSVQILPR